LDTGENGSWEKFIYNQLALSRKPSVGNKLIKEMKPIAWNELKELIQEGHTIGAHTLNHARLSEIMSLKELEKEIIGSGDILEDRLNIKVDWFAYPFGDVKSINNRAYKIIKKRYKHCYTGIRGNNYNNQNQYALWRDYIDLSWPVDYIEFILRGGIDWYYYRKRKKILKMASY